MYMEVVEKVTHMYKNSVFKKSCPMMAWQNLHVRGLNARYACMEKIRVITPVSFFMNT
jgi:hypothetical protein